MDCLGLMNKQLKNYTVKMLGHCRYMDFFLSKIEHEEGRSFNENMSDGYTLSFCVYECKWY